jgi:carotenoid cleavage dioxygenase-like enzyme
LISHLCVCVCHFFIYYTNIALDLSSLDNPVSAHSPTRTDDHNNGDHLLVNIDSTYTVNADSLKWDGPILLRRISAATGIVKSYFRPSSEEFSKCPTFGRFSRFAYTAIQDSSKPGGFTGFCIWDMHERKLHATVYYKDGEGGGEPMMIESDDGSNKVHVGVYLQKKTRDDDSETFFALYDGETAELVARLQMPNQVPHESHGLWVSGEDLREHFAHHL